MANLQIIDAQYTVIIFYLVIITDCWLLLFLRDIFISL